MAQTIRIKDADGNELKLLANADGSYSLPVKAELLGSNLVETKTEADAVEGVIIFSSPVSFIEIVNKDSVNDGVFTVNGIPIPLVPSTKDTNGNYTFLSVFEKEGVNLNGTRSAEVTITGSTSYTLARYE